MSYRFILRAGDVFSINDPATQGLKPKKRNKLLDEIYLKTEELFKEHDVIYDRKLHNAVLELEADNQELADAKVRDAIHAVEKWYNSEYNQNESFEYEPTD